MKTARKTHIFFDKEKIEEKMKNKVLPSASRFSKWSIFLRFFQHNAFFSPIPAIRYVLLTSLKITFNVYSCALYVALEWMLGRCRYQIPTRSLVILLEDGELCRLCSTGTLPLIVRHNFLLLSLQFTAHRSVTCSYKWGDISVHQKPSSATSTDSASQEISLSLQKTKVHYRVDKQDQF